MFGRNNERLEDLTYRVASLEACLKTHTEWLKKDFERLKNIDRELADPVNDAMTSRSLFDMMNEYWDSRPPKKPTRFSRLEEKLDILIKSLGMEIKRKPGTEPKFVATKVKEEKAAKEPK